MYAWVVGVTVKISIDSQWSHPTHSFQEVKIHIVYEKECPKCLWSHWTRDFFCSNNGHYHLRWAEWTHVEDLTQLARKTRTHTLILFCKPVWTYKFGSFVLLGGWVRVFIWFPASDLPGQMTWRPHHSLQGQRLCSRPAATPLTSCETCGSHQTSLTSASSHTEGEQPSRVCWGDWTQQTESPMERLSTQKTLSTFRCFTVSSLVLLLVPPWQGLGTAYKHSF